MTHVLHTEKKKKKKNCRNQHIMVNNAKSCPVWVPYLGSCKKQRPFSWIFIWSSGFCFFALAGWFSDFDASTPTQVFVFVWSCVFDRFLWWGLAGLDLIRQKGVSFGLGQRSFGVLFCSFCLILKFWFLVQTLGWSCGMQLWKVLVLVLWEAIEVGWRWIVKRKFFFPDGCL